MNANPLKTLAAVALAAVAIMLLVGPCTPGRAPTWRQDPIGKFVRWITWRTVNDEFKPAPAPAARCLIFGFDSCGDCRILYRDIRRDLVPHGWKIGTTPDCDFEKIDVKGSDPRANKFKPAGGWNCPTLVIVDANDRELTRKVGGLQTDDLVAWLQTFRK